MRDQVIFSRCLSVNLPVENEWKDNREIGMTAFGLGVLAHAWCFICE